MTSHSFFKELNFSSVQLLSHVQLFATPWTSARQASLSITSSRSFLRLVSIKSVMPSNHLILCHPLLFMPSIFPSIRPFSNEWFFVSGGQGIGASASASVLPMNIQDWFPLGWFDFLAVQEFSPIPQFKSINSSALSFFYSPTLTSIYDYEKNHSFEYTDLCRQSNVSAF